MVPTGTYISTDSLHLKVYSTALEGLVIQEHIITKHNKVLRGMQSPITRSETQVGSGALGAFSGHPEGGPQK